MKKFNILITNYNRNTHFKICLNYLFKNLGIKTVGDKIKHDVSLSFLPFNDKFGIIDGKFCKSIVLNKLIEKLSDDFDYLIQLDCDLIVRPDLLDIIINEDKDWLVLGGLKLSEKSTRAIFDDEIPYEYIEKMEVENSSREINSRKGFVGNIAVRKECYLKYLEITKQKELYDPRFIGWGGEDSVLSMTSTHMANNNLITKKYLPDAWRHMWHEKETEKPGFDNKQFDKNCDLMSRLVGENVKKMQEYINGRTSRPEPVYN